MNNYNEKAKNTKITKSKKQNLKINDQIPQNTHKGTIRKKDIILSLIRNNSSISNRNSLSKSKSQSKNGTLNNLSNISQLNKFQGLSHTSEVNQKNNNRLSDGNSSKLKKEINEKKQKTSLNINENDKNKTSIQVKQSK